MSLTICVLVGHATLQGKRIMFTSPRQYACKLAYKFVEKGGKPIWLPGIKITKLCDPNHQQARLIYL